MYHLFKPLLFRLDPERAHHLGLRALGALHTCGLTGVCGTETVSAPKSVMGLTFLNPVGLAAGMDKDGRFIDALGALGFGFIEVGTVTPRPQPGNPRPRLFRIPDERALINRMGFNNAGVDALLPRLQRRRYTGRIGVNIGKNAETPIEDALGDYRTCMRKVYPHTDYIAVNISSPNTPGLRELHEQDRLRALLEGLKSEQERLTEEHGMYVPFAVKISPDLGDDSMEALAAMLLDHRVDGVIATNTTTGRSGITHSDRWIEQGGVSGAPLREPSTRAIRVLRQTLRGRIPIIGVGGILSADDAREKTEAGADLLEIYTGLIYRGPELIRVSAEAALAGCPA